MHTKSMHTGIVERTGSAEPAHSEHVEITIPHRVSMPEALWPVGTLDESGAKSSRVPEGNPLFVGTEDPAGISVTQKPHEHGAKATTRQVPVMDGAGGIRIKQPKPEGY